MRVCVPVETCCGARATNHRYIKIPVCLCGEVQEQRIIDIPDCMCLWRRVYKSNEYNRYTQSACACGDAQDQGVTNNRYRYSRMRVPVSCVLGNGYPISYPRQCCGSGRPCWPLTRLFRGRFVRAIKTLVRCIRGRFRHGSRKRAEGSCLHTGQIYCIVCLYPLLPEASHYGHRVDPHIRIEDELVSDLLPVVLSTIPGSSVWIRL
jgi:hypothetical protein